MPPARVGHRPSSIVARIRTDNLSTNDHFTKSKTDGRPPAQHHTAGSQQIEQLVPLSLPPLCLARARKDSD